MADEAPAPTSTTNPVTNSGKRRSHRKSRNGCRQCKQAHIKCDERRPACLHCSAANRRCSYLDQLVSNATTTLLRHASHHQQQPWQEPETATAASGPSSASSPVSLGAGKTPAPPGAPHSQELELRQVYDLNHLALLHHLETSKVDPWHVRMADQHGPSVLLDMAIDVAISNPYLMDELLAFSALHLSTLEDQAEAESSAGKCAYYRDQAVQLQTRALRLFNAVSWEEGISDDNCTAMFLFSAILGLHVLFDAVTSHRNGEFIDFLDSFVGYLGLQRGVRVATSQGWHIICQTRGVKSILEQIYPSTILDGTGLDAETALACERWMNFLLLRRDREEDGAAAEACVSAFGLLQNVMARHGALSPPMNTHVILAWPVQISQDYAEALSRRWPEALITLAYWAVLLHRSHEFWIFGRDGGKFLVESIAQYLDLDLGDASWAEWMTWPRSAVRGSF